MSVRWWNLESGRQELFRWWREYLLTRKCKFHKPKWLIWSSMWMFLFSFFLTTSVALHAPWMRWDGRGDQDSKPWPRCPLFPAGEKEPLLLQSMPRNPSEQLQAHPSVTVPQLWHSTLHSETHMHTQRYSFPFQIRIWFCQLFLWIVRLLDFVELCRKQKKRFGVSVRCAGFRITRHHCWRYQMLSQGEPKERPTPGMV